MQVLTETGDCREVLSALTRRKTWRAWYFTLGFSSNGTEVSCKKEKNPLAAGAITNTLQLHEKSSNRHGWEVIAPWTGNALEKTATTSLKSPYFLKNATAFACASFDKIAQDSLTSSALSFEYTFGAPVHIINQITTKCRHLAIQFAASKLLITRKVQQREKQRYTTALKFSSQTLPTLHSDHSQAD